MAQQLDRGVPFVDLDPSHMPLKDAILAEIAELIDTGEFTNGPAVASFEQDFAHYCGTGDCVGLASGLDAIRLSLLACGVGPGDEVIVPAFTFVATIEAVTQARARPVLVDVTETDYTIEPLQAAAAIGPETRAIVPVHLYGQLADMTLLTETSSAAGVLLIEDAAQAHGAERDGYRAGATGHAGCFSFYPGKNLGAMGDAGAVTCSDPDFAATLRALREHGQTAKYRHEVEGYTARLDTIQAIVLRHKLALLDSWNVQRRRAAAAYIELLAGVGDLGLPTVAPGSNPVWHLFVVTTPDPDDLAAHLAARGIGTARHYPQPIHLTPAYNGLRYAEGSFPVAERLAQTALSLPMFAGITDGQIEQVAQAVQGYFAG